MAEHRSSDVVADAYGVFASDEEVYVIETIACEPGRRREVADELSRHPEGSPPRQPIGAWATICGDCDEITRLVAFTSLAHLEADALDRLIADRRPEGADPLMRGRTRRLATKLPYGSSLIARDRSQPPTDSRRIYHLMTVECTRTGVGSFVGHFESGVATRRALDEQLVPIAAWQTSYGGQYFNVEHVYAYDSLADMERCRKLLHADEGFREHNRVNTSPNPPNNWYSGATSKLWIALPGSAL
jgi:hypothetical protein